MKLELNEYVFARMQYIENEMEIQKSIGSNPRSEQYYKTLLEIRDIQNSGQIPSDELYRRFAEIKGHNQQLYDSVEYGYYLANIHYYLFESRSEYEKTNEYKDVLNKRILYFLNNADRDNLLFKCGEFLTNFPFNYLRFLEHFYSKRLDNYYQDSCTSDVKRFVETYGKDDEKEIANIIYELEKK